jgi:hypothetical protein
MSFVDTLGGLVKSVGGFLQSNSTGSQLAKTALYGFALRKIQQSILKEQEEKARRDDPGTTISVDPDPNNAVPVVYGDAYTSGLITDVHMTENNKTMWVCVTLSEMTGNLIDGSASAITFNEVYYNGLRLRFDTTGNVVSLLYDDVGNSTDKFAGLIEVYPFVNGSQNPVKFITEPFGNTATYAYDLFPSWSSTDMMNGLVFALIKITYNKENRVTQIGDFKFKLSNTMKQPGDVLFDYMTNTRYGAGIPAAEINQ